MTIEVERFGGIAITWLEIGLTMLVDPTARELWIVLHGRPVIRRAIPSC